LTSKVDITLSIVNFNTSEMLDGCLGSIFQSTTVANLEVIVVDNGSTDSSVAMVHSKYPSVKVIANNSNLYFTRAHNQALALATGRYFLIMNSDILVFPETLGTMITLMDQNPTVGASSCVLLTETLAVARTCWTFPDLRSVLLEHRLAVWLFPRSRTRARYNLAEWDRLSSRDVDVVMDAFLMARSDAIKSIAGYDERYLLYYTEQDLCLRLHRRGWRITHWAEARVVHIHEHTSRSMNPWRIWWIRRRDAVAYFQKHHGWLPALVLNIVLSVDVLLRVPAKFVWSRVWALRNPQSPLRGSR
jgi:GT2 family glycosyltransferase